MKRVILSALTLVFAWLGLSITPAAAQNIYPYQAPRYGPGYTTPLSPYLNLLLPGNTAVNYYGLVQPLFRARQYRNQNDLTLQGIMNQLPEPPGIVADEIDTQLPSTGHPTAFSYTGTYFNSTPYGQPILYPQRPSGMGRGGAGPIGANRGAMGMGGAGGMGRGGGAGVWPNMRTGMGQYGR